jgi:hypothetical protein
MALLAEEIVEEWVRRSGFFTLRGVRIGVHEIDLLAVRYRPGQEPECRHIEVQASVRPMSYISKVPKALQKQGRPPTSAKRTDEELEVGVAEWVKTKFTLPRKVALMKSLFPTNWSRELVIHNVKAQKEVELIRGHGISVISLGSIIESLRRRDGFVESAAGGDFAELVTLSPTSGI